jgi:hypothetical protein
MFLLVHEKSLFNLKLCSASFLIFLMTLQSFYFMGASILCYIGAALLAFWGLIRFKVDKFFLLFSLFVVTLLSIHYVGRVFFHGVDVADVKVYLSTSAMVFLLPLWQQVINSDFAILCRSVALVILIHSLAVFAQLVYWVLIGDYLDLLGLLGGEESRAVSSKALVLSGDVVPRFTGLFNEPGTYSVVVFSLVSTYCYLIRKLDFVVLLSLISIVITMSAFGIVLSVLLLAYAFLFLGNARRLGVIFLVFLATILAVYAGVQVALVERFDSEGSGLSFRTQMLEFYYDKASVFGIGVSELPAEFVINDLGLWFYLLFYYGLFGLVLILLMGAVSLLKSKNFMALFVFGLIMLTKLKFTYPLYWFVFLMIAVRSADRNQRP